MLAWTINWRKNLFLSILVLLFVNGFFAHTEQLSYEWWIEQERMPRMSWQIVKRTIVISPWYVRYQNIFSRWQCLIKSKLIVFLYIQILKIIGLIWIWFLEKSILYMAAFFLKGT